MAFTAGQVLTAAQLNDLDIDSLTIDANSPVLTIKDSDSTGTSNFEVKFTDSANTALARIYGGGGNDIRFEVAGSNHTIMSDSGRLGVGTFGPETMLHVVTTNKLGSTFTGTTDGEGLRVDQSNYSANNYVSLVEASYDDGQTEPHVRMGAQFTSGGSKLSFGTSNNYGNGITNQALTIDTAGKIGIGTNSPTNSQVHIVHGGEALRMERSGYDTYGFQNSAGSGIEFRNFTDSRTEMIFSGSGTVGIGTTSPGAKLHVHSGNTNTTSVFESGDANAYIGIKDNSTSGNAYVGIGAVGDELRLRAGNSNIITGETGGTFKANVGSFYAAASGHTLYAASPPTGTGNDAEWAAPLGIYILYRNSSLAAEKENISADLGEHLTADMIDSVVPKMWNRLNAPGYPEIGPLAEDMDAISPFLAARGTTAENVPFLTGINKTAYLSLLVLAVKDLRTRVAALEA